LFACAVSAEAAAGSNRKMAQGDSLRAFFRFETVAEVSGLTLDEIKALRG
jgi:hypothetical protein